MQPSLDALILNRFAGRRIAAHARTALAHDEDAEPVEIDAGTLLQMLGDQGNDVFQHRIGALLRELMLLWRAGLRAGRWKLVSTFAAVAVAMDGFPSCKSTMRPGFYGIFHVRKRPQSKKAPKYRSFLTLSWGCGPEKARFSGAFTRRRLCRTRYSRRARRYAPICWCGRADNRKLGSADTALAHHRRPNPPAALINRENTLDASPYDALCAPQKLFTQALALAGDGDAFKGLQAARASCSELDLLVIGDVHHLDVNLEGIAGTKLRMRRRSRTAFICSASSVCNRFILVVSVCGFNLFGWRFAQFDVGSPFFEDLRAWSRRRGPC